MSINNHWQIFPKQEKISEKIGKLLNCLPIIGQLLINRNIKNITEADQFINPNWTSFPELPNHNDYHKEISKLIKIYLYFFLFFVISFIN